MPHGAMALPALVFGRDWRRSWRRCGHWSGLCRAASLLGLAPLGNSGEGQKVQIFRSFFGELNQLNLSLSSHA